MENKLKLIIGDYAFTIAILQDKLDQLQRELEITKKELDECQTKQD